MPMNEKIKIWVINGPNINMLGIREKEIYSSESYAELCEKIKKFADDKYVDTEIFQSNSEGTLVDIIQKAYFEKVDGIVINPGAYTHTSVALLDAVLAVNINTVEVHISDLSKREDFRQISYIRRGCRKTIMGKGSAGYLEAMEYLISLCKKDK